ncbi:MAG: hypothetical protein U9Q99_02860, partial [Nanoarchaeota archaeon]|nr:hypothetical protein [Nanoarchaeota archaeon]
MPENKPQYKKLENALVANEFIKKEQYTGANIAFYEHVKPNLGEEAQKYVEATMGLDDPKIIKKLVEASYKDFMGNFEEQKIKDIFDYFKTLIGDSLEKEKVEKLKKYFDDFGK